MIPISGFVSSEECPSPRPLMLNFGDFVILLLADTNCQGRMLFVIQAWVSLKKKIAWLDIW